MSLIPTIYSSTDPGAPQLSGTAGSLISVLRAVLVTGYGIAPSDKPGLGWTEEFTGVNVAAFRNNPVTGSGYRLRLDDNAAQYAMARGFEEMTDVDNGTGPVPTATQMSNGTYVLKSSLANSTSRAWWVIGTERFFYLFVDESGRGIEMGRPMWFGDINSVVPGDRHQFAVSRMPGTSTSTATEALNNDNYLHVGPSSSAAGYVARKADQVIGSDRIGIVRSAFAGTQPYLGYDGMPYPGVLGKLFYEPGYLRDGAYAMRGQMPGLYVPLHSRPFADRTILEDLPELPAGTKLIAKTFAVNTSGVQGEVLFDIINEW